MLTGVFNFSLFILPFLSFSSDDIDCTQGFLFLRDDTGGVRHDGATAIENLVFVHIIECMYCT